MVILLLQQQDVLTCTKTKNQEKPASNVKEIKDNGDEKWKETKRGKKKKEKKSQSQEKKEDEKQRVIRQVRNTTKVKQKKKKPDWRRLCVALNIVVFVYRAYNSHAKGTVLF